MKTIADLVASGAWIILLSITMALGACFAFVRVIVVRVASITRRSRVWRRRFSDRPE